MNRRALLKMLVVIPLAAIAAKVIKPKLMLTDADVERAAEILQANQLQTPFLAFDGRMLVVSGKPKRMMKWPR